LFINNVIVHNLNCILTIKTFSYAIQEKLFRNKQRISTQLLNTVHLVKAAISRNKSKEIICYDIMAPKSHSE